MLSCGHCQWLSITTLPSSMRYMLKHISVGFVFCSISIFNLVLHDSIISLLFMSTVLRICTIYQMAAYCFKAMKWKAKNTTLSERKIPHYQNKKYHTIRAKNTTLSEQKIPHYQNSSKIQWKNKKYHTIRTVLKSNRKTKNTTLSEQFQNLIEKQKIPHCQNSSKI